MSSYPMNAANKRLTTNGRSSPRLTASPGRRASGGHARRALAGTLDLYKRYLSPLLPRACRFAPTCSEYAKLAILEHGIPRGVLLAAGRLMRCHPMHPGGIDLP